MESKGRVILKKLGGLSNIKSMKGRPLEFGQNEKDRDSDGELMGEYKEPGLPGAKHFLSPQWSDLTDQYSWGGSPEDLALIVNKSRLRFIKGHYREGEIIEPSDVNRADINDAFFTHPNWYGKKYMEGGRIMLNRDNIDEEFYHLCYKGLTEYVLDKTQDQNVVFKKGARYELINPKIARAKKAQDAKAAVNALVALSNMEYEKQRLIAEIMQLRTYNIDDVDPDSLFIALKDEGAENEQPESKFDGKTGREKFMELAEASNSDLNVMSEIIRAKRVGVLRPRGTYYQFNTGNNSLSDKIEGIQNDWQLINFFRKIENQDYYIELSKQLELKKQKA